MGASEEFTQVDDCDLCEAARITTWFHEDEICWIAECEICDVPMVVWRFHGTEPPADHLEHMHGHLARVAGETLTVEHYVDDNMRNIPTTTTPTLVRRVASSAAASAADGARRTTVNRGRAARADRR